MLDIRLDLRMIDDLITEYKKALSDELKQDENADYRRGFYAGRLAAILEYKAGKEDWENKTNLIQKLAEIGLTADLTSADYKVGKHE